MVATLACEAGMGVHISPCLIRFLALLSSIFGSLSGYEVAVVATPIATLACYDIGLGLILNMASCMGSALFIWLCCCCSCRPLAVYKGVEHFVFLLFNATITPH